MFRHFPAILIVFVLAGASPVLGQGNNGHGPGGNSGPGNSGGAVGAGVGNMNGGGVNPGLGTGNSGADSRGPALGGGQTDPSAGDARNPGRAGYQDEPATGDGGRARMKENPGSVAAPPGANLSGPGGGNGSPAAIVSLTPDQAWEAVLSRRATPLVELAEAVRQRAGGEIVDVNLLRVNQILVYAIKVLEPDGHLSVQYYYAQSGRYIGSD